MRIVWHDPCEAGVVAAADAGTAFRLQS
jgi:hypothetical protein